MGGRVAAIGVVVAFAVAGTALASTSGPPLEKHTTAGTAKARSVVLRRSDFGAGWLAKPSSSSPSGTPHCNGYDPDESDLVEIGSADSPSFQMGVRFVSSSAGVYATAAQAQTSWNRVLQPRLPECLGSLVAKGATSNGVPTKVTGYAKLALPRLAPRTAGYRIHFTATTQGLNLAGSVDLILLGKDRVDSVMISVSFGTPPAADELRLARRIASRL